MMLIYCRKQTEYFFFFLETEKIALQVTELMCQSKKTKQIFLLPLLSKTAAVLRVCSGFPSCLVGASML